MIKHARIYSLLFALAALLLAACGTDSAATALPTATLAATTAPASATPAVVATTAPVATASTVATPTVAPATTSIPATIAPQPTATLAPTVTPRPTTPAADLPPRYIDALRARTFDGGTISLDRLYEQTAAYTGHTIYYMSDGLRISGLMMVPNGPKDAKYPVALINHGHFAFNDYDTAWDTLREDRYFARNGYITIASDYRNYARSDKGDIARSPGYTDDILNLIAAVKKLPNADPNKITIMGHSMGSEITMNVLVVSKDIRVAALFGAMSPDAADNYYARIRWSGGTNPPENSAYGDPTQNADAYRRMSPLTYFNDISVPVIIHSGDNDNVTPQAWSVKIFDALKADGKKTAYYTYPGEGHSLNGAAFDSAMTRTLAFFNAALGRSISPKTGHPAVYYAERRMHRRTGGADEDGPVAVADGRVAGGAGVGL